MVLGTVRRRLRSVLCATKASKRARRWAGLALAVGIPVLLLVLVFGLSGQAGAAETKAGPAHARALALVARPAQVFSATVHVVPSTTSLRVGESLSVSVAIQVSEGCRFPIYELTLRLEEPIFAHTSPPTATVGPPVSNPFTYTLTAVATGTVTLGALAYGERYCGDFWAWRYLNGTSVPVTVWTEQRHAYLPLIRWPCSIAVHGTAFWPQPPGPVERYDDRWFGASLSYTSDCETVAHVSAFQVYPGETPTDCTSRTIPPGRPFWAHQADNDPGDHFFDAHFRYVDLPDSDRLVTRVQVLQRRTVAQQLYCTQRVYRLSP